MNVYGEFIVEIIKNGKTIERKKIRNQLTAVNLTTRMQMLMGQFSGGADALQIKYFAFGDGSTPATAEQTALVNERFRKQITTVSSSGNTVRSVVALSESDANFNIKEIGVFGGPSATSTAGSGTMLARVVVDINKTSSLAINIVRNDVCNIND